VDLIICFFFLFSILNIGNQQIKDRSKKSFQIRVSNHYKKKKTKLHMEKVKIDLAKNENPGITTIRAGIALILAKAISLVENIKHDPDEFLDEADNIIDAIGEENAKQIVLRREIQPKIIEFKMNPEAILEPGKRVVIEDVKDDTPWYNRFLDERKSSNKWKYENRSKKLFQKRTRNK